MGLRRDKRPKDTDRSGADTANGKRKEGEAAMRPAEHSLPEQTSAQADEAWKTKFRVYPLRNEGTIVPRRVARAQVTRAGKKRPHGAPAICQAPIDTDCLRTGKHRRR